MLNSEQLRSGNNSLIKKMNKISYLNIKKESWMELQKGYKQSSFLKLWKISAENWSGSNRSVVSQQWSTLQNRIEDVVRQKKVAEDRLSRSSHKEKISYTQSS